MLKKIIIIIISIELFSLLILLFGRTINLGFRFFERQEPLIVYFSKKIYLIQFLIIKKFAIFRKRRS